MRRPCSTYLQKIDLLSAKPWFSYRYLRVHYVRQVIFLITILNRLEHSVVRIVTATTQRPIVRRFDDPFHKII